MTPYSIDIETIQLELLLACGTTWPEWKLNQPHQVINTTNNDYQRQLLIEIDVDNHCNKIIIDNHGKLGQQTLVDNGTIVRDQSLKVNQIWVNNILLEKSQIQSTALFYPDYPDHYLEYAQEHHINTPKQVNTLEFYFNGRWVLEFQRPFFAWYNALLMNELTLVNHWFKQSHLGIADDQQLSALNQLVKNLS